MPENQKLTCPSCRATFVNLFPAGECDVCQKKVCGHCIHYDHPDYAGTICQQCLVRRSPMGQLRELDTKTLLSILADPESADSPLVARLAGDFKETALVDGLRRALRSHRTDVRREAAVALGKIGDTAAAPDLIECLNDQVPAVRSRAAAACGLLGSRAAVAPLKRLLDDPSRQVAGNAVIALVHLMGKKGTALFEQLARDHAFAIVRCEALTGLSRIDREAGLRTALHCLESHAKEVVIRACGILATLNDVRAMPGLQKLLDSGPKATVRINAQAALQKIVRSG